jgi:hypothetical protein
MTRYVVTLQREISQEVEIEVEVEDIDSASGAAKEMMSRQRSEYWLTIADSEPHTVKIEEIDE